MSRKIILDCPDDIWKNVKAVKKKKRYKNLNETTTELIKSGLYTSR